jgi:hypothetical protein
VYFYRPFINTFLGPIFLISIQFSKTLIICFSFKARDQVSHPYNETIHLPHQIWFSHLATNETAQSLQRLTTGWTIGWLWFESRWGLGIFHFDTVSRPALGPKQPPIQWVPGALSLGVKRLGRKADHSSPSSAEAKEYVELYLHSSIRIDGMVLS